MMICNVDHRFDQSKSAERRRSQAGTSLEKIFSEFRNALDGCAAPMFAIDALHDAEDQHSRQEFLRACQSLWDTVQRFSEAPVEHIENVKDKISKLNDKIANVTAELEDNKKRHEEETKKMQAGFAKLQEKSKQELARMEQERKKKEAELQKELKKADEARKADIIRMQAS